MKMHSKSFFNKIDHVGIAVLDLDIAIKNYKNLGFDYLKRELLNNMNVEVAFFQIGESKIELLAAIKDNGPIAKFISRKGGKGGIHHLAFNVKDIGRELKRLKSSGISIVKDEVQEGAGNKRVAFLHPKDTEGALIELCQQNE